MPVLLSVASLPLSLIFFLADGFLLSFTGYQGEGMQPIVRSIIAAFVSAGFPEELSKLLMMLLSFLLFHSKIKNVYECILIGAAIGFGFTTLEEFAYGSSGLAALLRLFTIGAHMCFGIVMSRHLGMALHKKLSGAGGAAGDCILALVLPVLIHTLYDAFTAFNRMMENEDDAISLAGMLLALVTILIMFIWQIVSLVGLKKNAEKYCAMDVSKM